MSHNCLIRARVDLTYHGLCLLLGLSLFLCSCGSRTTRKASSVNRFKNVQVSAAELSYRNQSLLALYSSEIEGGADKIILESPSSATRRQALVWKADAIPVLQTSMLNTDPVAAVVDTWAFIFQMNAYTDQPMVKNQLGAFLPVVADTLKEMDAQMEQLVLTAAPVANIPDLRRRIGEWADAHPIQTGLAGRRSADVDLIKQVDERDLGALASLKALQEGLGDITARLDTYNTYLPKQARWQAELLLSDLTQDPQVSAAVSNLTILSKALDTTSNNLDRMPEMAARAREVALADVENQRLAAQSFFTQERTEVMDALAQQRIAATADLRGERLAATADLRKERQIVLDSVHQEEMAAMNDLHILSQQTLNDFDKRSRDLTDHLFWRAIELVLTALLLFSLTAWILLRRFVTRALPNRGYHDRAA
jgi:hypothetical protein